MPTYLVYAKQQESFLIITHILKKVLKTGTAQYHISLDVKGTHP